MISPTHPIHRDAPDLLGALAGLYAAFVAGAPAFNWLATGVFVGFGVAWILLYRRAEG